MEAPSLKAVTLTHVRYQRGDQIGHFLAWISLIPVFISLGGFAAHILFRRELQTISFAVGLIVSQIVNELVKSSVQESRPETCYALETCESHGWPSSHSQYMFFFATYFLLLSFKYDAVWGPAKKAILNALHFSLAVLTLYSRVYLGYHSIAQVFAGAALGSVLGGAWYWFVNYVLHPYFPAVEESSIGRWFCAKDTSHIPNVLKFEYDNARAARRALIDGDNKSD